MTGKPIDRNYKVSNVSGRLVANPNSGWITGQVQTPYGYVVCDMVDGKKPYACIQFIWRGRSYTRVWRRSFTRVGMARLAARFAREIAETAE